MILYFSATGNSAYVARRLSAALDDRRMVDLHGCLGKRVQVPGPFSLEKGEKVGFVFPVHSWGMPRGLAGLLASLVFDGVSPSTYCYMVCSCGDDAGLVARQWRKAVARCGLGGMSSFSVFMPNTYVLLPGFDVDAPDVVKRKLDAAPGEIDSIARRIKSGETGDFTYHGGFAWLKSKVVYPVFMAALTDKPFRVDKAACLHCGKCSRVCPAGNVDMQDKSPRWGGWCMNCLACYHLCPARCISYASRCNRKGVYSEGFKLDSGCK